MKRLCIVLAAASALTLAAQGQTAPRPPAPPSPPAAPAVPASALQQTLRTTEDELRDTLERLAQLQAQIQEERIPLARELRELENEVTVKRRELERMQRLRDNSSLTLAQLQQQTRARQENVDYMANLVGEYGRALEVRLRGSERQILADRITQFENIRNNPDLDRSAKLLQTTFVVDMGIDRAVGVLGGTRMNGEAALPSGEIVSGQFLMFGPVTFFASGETAGMALANVQGPPTVAPLTPQQNAQIAGTVRSGSGPLPLDSTLGKAAAIASTEETWLEHVGKGGIWMYPILASGLVAAAVVLIKLIQLLRLPKPDFTKVHDILIDLRAGDGEGARAKAEQMPGVAGQMLRDGVDHSGESEELIEEIMMERILDVQPKLEGMLPFIAVAAATAPLLGLLGTVTGMINTFTLITVFGTGDAKSLSSGISEAMITTEYGLIVAIPAVIAHALLSRRVQTELARLEHIAVSFVNGLSRPTIERR